MRPIDRLVVVQILQRFLPPEASVWVFGSRARGATKRAADLDLAIDVGRKLTSAVQSELDSAFEMSELPYRVDVVDMQAASGIFRENILRDRIPFLVELQQRKAALSAAILDAEKAASTGFSIDDITDLFKPLK